MKIFSLIIILQILSCRILEKGKEIDLCDNNNFYQSVKKVSLDDIDRIRKLHGRFVEVEGFLHANFEDFAVYPSKSSHSMDAIWLDSKLPDSLLDKVNGKKVKVIGRVNILHKGHLNGYLATLDSAFCLKEVVQ